MKQVIYLDSKSYDLLESDLKQKFPEFQYETHIFLSEEGAWIIDLMQEIIDEKKIEILIYIVKKAFDISKALNVRFIKNKKQTGFTIEKRYIPNHDDEAIKEFLRNEFNKYDD